MRIARLLGLVLAIMAARLLITPRPAADPPLRVPDYVTDNANVLSQGQRVQVDNAVNQLYNERHIRLWVVYVDTFSGQDAVDWTQQTRRLSDIGGPRATPSGATRGRA